MAKQLFKNGASATLAVSINNTDVSVQVQAGYGALYPSPTGGDWFLVTLEDNNANVEILKCTARSGDLLTVVRAQEGTAAQSFTNTVTRVEVRNTKGSMERMLQRSGDTLGGDLELGGYALSGPGSIGPDVDIDPVAVFPVGMIVLWSGAIGAIPAGWALCNGANGTPDLRSRFVIGAGSVYSVDQTGGSSSGAGGTDTAGAHDHGGAGAHVLTEAEMPAHNHRLWGWTGTGTNDNGTALGNAGAALDGDTGHPSGWVDQNGSAQPYVEDAGSGAGHTHPISSDGGHTHTVTVSVIPPYYALAYIMFTG